MREAKTTRRDADKLVGVILRDGAAVWVLIHVEVQGEPESAFGERMYTYHYTRSITQPRRLGHIP